MCRCTRSVGRRPWRSTAAPPSPRAWRSLPEGGAEGIRWSIKEDEEEQKGEEQGQQDEEEDEERGGELAPLAGKPDTSDLARLMMDFMPCGGWAQAPPRIRSSKEWEPADPSELTLND